MCCRYWIDDSPDLAEIVSEMNKSPLLGKWRDAPHPVSHGEVRPTDIAPVIAPNRSGLRQVYPMKWGFKGRSLLLNARVETAGSKATFREAWNRHRCIVPASWYYEWEHITEEGGRKRTGDKYRINPKRSGLTWLCGLYRIEEGLPVFVVLTRKADDSILFIHDRMPLILPEECIDRWICPDTRPETLLPEVLTDMSYEVAEEKRRQEKMSAAVRQRLLQQAERATR